MLDREAVKGQMSDLRSELNCTTPIIVSKDNDLERLDKGKEKLQQNLDRVRQRIRQVGVILWREGV